ncbi:MAG: hypothetical protein IKA19_09450 [Muribaculaceae bacterium]|nr:hypothetical protein [Muribaculaceae bacterium]
MKYEVLGIDLPNTRIRVRASNACRFVEPVRGRLAERDSPQLLPSGY